MPKTIRIYSTPNCQQCRATYRWLDKRGIQYSIEDATDELNNAAIKALGYTAAPVVVVEGAPGIHWSGFVPGKLAEHCAA